MMENVKRFLRDRARPLLIHCVAFTVVVMISARDVHAQQWPFDLWHEGQVVLVEGDTLKGKVKYDLQQQLVQFSKNDVILEALTPRKVLFFEIFDNTVHQYRKFFSLPYSSAGTYEVPYFFELLEEGKITLLCQEALEYRSVPVGYYGGSYNRLVMVNSYYILDTRGRIVEFSGKKGDLMELMGNRSEEVEKFMRKNRLRIEEKSDLAKIVAFYNSLSRS
jgi:hypothetical protein